ncbi:unnamed protein product [Victoria cruziana]
MGSRSRSPPRVHRTRGGDRYSYRDAPYKRDFRGSTRSSNLCNNCKRPGHYAKDCPNVSVCNNCGLPGHIASECSTKSLCWNCREPGHIARHVARDCPKADMIGERAGGFGGMARGSSFRDVVCRNCNQVGHMSRECMAPMMICHNCGGRGHAAYECPSGRISDRGLRRY